jgi:hypothetical protein
MLAASAAQAAAQYTVVERSFDVKRKAAHTQELAAARAQAAEKLVHEQQPRVSTSSGVKAGAGQVHKPRARSRQNQEPSCKTEKTGNYLTTALSLVRQASAMADKKNIQEERDRILRTTWGSA